MINPEIAGAWGWLSIATSAGVMASMVYGDLRDAKIPNSLTYPAALAGITLHLAWGLADPDISAWMTVKDSLFGFLLAFGVLFAGFIFGGIGGGDVKGCAAMGALCGLATSCYGLLYMMLVGGAMALSIAIWKGNLWRTLRTTWRFFLSALIPGLKVEMPKEENSDKFPLGVAIAVGFAWAMVEEGWLNAAPLIDLGI